jgi:hypothetical protein
VANKLTICIDILTTVVSKEETFEVEWLEIQMSDRKFKDNFILVEVENRRNINGACCYR